MISFKNKKVLIIGNNLGFEKDVAIKLNNLGANILLITQNEILAKETISLLKGDNNRYLNFTNIKDIENSVENTDIYIHFADEQIDNLYLIDHNKLQNIFNKNVTSYINFIKAISSKKQDVNNLSVLYISSNSNQISGLNMSKTLSLELFEQNIRVNSLAIDNRYKYDFNENSNELMERISSMASYIVSENAKFIVGEIYKIN
jgi:enoyl-[acyl-carrier-protein] reductase (NADH)